MLLFCVNRRVGRRIVDVLYIFQQLQNSVHNIAFGCSFMNSEFVKEIRSGYFCTWTFKCKMCNIITKIESEKVDHIFQSIKL